MAARRGFTLVEFLIALVIIAVLATIILPNLLTAKIAANETAALTLVRHVAQSQLQFVNTAAADLNTNGAGEYATFGELSGGTPIRASQGGMEVLDPTLMSPTLSLVDALGELVRHGYRFRIYLPDDVAAGLEELPGGGAAAAVDADRAEGLWCLYAWPSHYGATGRRTFFMNQMGEVLFTEDPDYSGEMPALPADAAFVPGGTSPGSIAGMPASGAQGRDGNTWYVAAN